MGHFSAQPEGSGLSHHAGRAQAARARAGGLRTYAPGNQPGDGAGRVMTRLAQLFRRRRLDRELAAEIEAHIEERADELVESGMDPAEALLAARAQFGNRTSLLEQSREVWSFPLLETLLRDLRIGARALRHAPLFTAAAVATLALGIGANTAVFSVLDAVLLKPLPFPESERIVMLWEHPPKTIVTASLGTRNQQNPASPSNFLAWRDRTHSFEAMAAINGPLVSADFFRILNVRPLVGRTFDASEDVPNGRRVVVLGCELWRSRFGSDPHVVGRTMSILGEPHTIIGVMPEGFDLTFAHAEFWAPAGITPATAADQGRYIDVIAKLKPGVSMASAQADLDNVARQIAAERPETNRGWRAGLISLYVQTTGEVSTARWLLFGAVTFVLLIAAGNVASLLLMRGTERQREIAVRAGPAASASSVNCSRRVCCCRSPADWWAWGSRSSDSAPPLPLFPLWRCRVWRAWASIFACSRSASLFLF